MTKRYDERGYEITTMEGFTGYISPEIVEYFAEKYNGQDVKVVHGHWPSMVTKNDVDEWIESLAELKRMIMENRKIHD